MIRHSALKALALVALVVCCASQAWGVEDTESIAITKVQQRYPWNGLVDIEFTAATNAVVYLSAMDGTTGESLKVETLTQDGNAFTNGVTVLTNKDVHLVWNASADVGAGVVVTNAKFYALMSAIKYMVIDISGGVDATSYPVTYLGKAPGGKWPDEYKTTKIVLRRIPAGTFTMGSPEGEVGRYYDNETQHEVTLTSDFWIGVFEMTQKQYELLVGSDSSYAYYKGDMRPVDAVSYNTIVGDSGPISNLITRTELPFTLPTEAQWEYACRAGTTNAWNNGTTITNDTTDANLALLGRYYSNRNDGKGDSSYTEHTTVGSYLPNNWGLYDMHGNVLEWCFDGYVEELGSSPVTDPTGSESASKRVFRSGCCFAYSCECRSAYRNATDPSSVYRYLGFRLACPAD